MMGPCFALSRDGINLQHVALLKKENVRHRSDILAERTGIPASTIAGRAMLLGLVIIEGDLTRLFPGGGKLPRSPPKKLTVAPRPRTAATTADLFDKPTRRHGCTGR